MVVNFVTKMVQLTPKITPRVVEIEGEKCLKTIFLIVKNVAKAICCLCPILVVKVLPYTTRHGSVVNQVAVST